MAKKTYRRRTPGSITAAEVSLEEKSDLEAMGCEVRLAGPTHMSIKEGEIAKVILPDRKTVAIQGEVVVRYSGGAVVKMSKNDFVAQFEQIS